MKQHWLPNLLRPLLLALPLAAAPLAPAALEEFYVGVDRRETIPTGTYAGQANPNHNRLTFLYAHTFQDNPANNHYHAISAYTLIGPADSPTIQPTSNNRRIPEQFTGQVPLILTDTVGGLYDGTLTLKPDRAVQHYSEIGFHTPASLDGFAPGTGEHFLFNSGGTAPAGRWADHLTGTMISLELVSITPGLRIGSAVTMDILSNPGDAFTLGAGETLNFDPVFWTPSGAAAGNYSAEFVLKDLNGLRGDSGTFQLDFQVVPEPSTWALVTVGTLGMGLWRLRRRS